MIDKIVVDENESPLLNFAINNGAKINTSKDKKVSRMVKHMLDDEYVDPGACGKCGHPLRLVRPGKSQCPYCDMERVLWMYQLEEMAHEIIHKLPWSQIVHFVQPEDKDTDEIRAALVCEIKRRME